MRIVVLRPLKLGDFLTGIPAYRAIRRAFPHDHITLAAPQEFADLARLLDGAIDDVVHAHELETLSAELADADIGIDIHGKGPESQRLLLAAGAKRIISFRHPAVPETFAGPTHEASEHEVERWCRMLSHHGIRADPSELDLAVPLIAVPQRARGATLIHPGASSEARCWPVERWTAVARAERRAGRRVILTGGTAEVERARAIARGAHIAPAHVYAGRTSLRELAALVAAAGRVVCGDTGVAHLATAYRRPSVLLFGPTAPSTWGPPPREFHHVLWGGTTGNPHAPVMDAGLRSITPESVMHALDRLS